MLNPWSKDGGGDRTALFKNELGGQLRFSFRWEPNAANLPVFFYCFIRKGGDLFTFLPISQ